MRTASQPRSTGTTTLLNNRFGEELLDILDGILTAFASDGLPPNVIARNMTPQEYQQHGDPGNWKYDGEKPGSGTPGRIPGDVKYYELWINEFGRRVEVHYFRDGARVIKEWTIKLCPWSP